ncbi:hypothetical protein GCM10007853_04640 [Algimonas ampicilliniresistens]|uniref:Uncharacterized protein n=1 Tax=Algimonas ampicilliniresistens TaxID=1298735 RepID=A0ABQ5V5B9_9PROT|nr:hypothetical protein GCM10007853_04640 [Algimonas ampicilliniresistens]
MRDRQAVVKSNTHIGAAIELPTGRAMARIDAFDRAFAFEFDRAAVTLAVR